MLNAARISRIATLTLALVAGALARPSAEDQKPADAQSEWTIPANAPNEVNPVPASPEVIARGKKIFENRCQRCHGRDGRGHGPEADPDHPAGNLTDRLRAAFNPDGVMFYKIWNGRQSPKMPHSGKKMFRKKKSGR